MAQAGQIRAGIGGWTFEPWRGVFYPQGLKHADELAYASRHLTSLELAATVTHRTLATAELGSRYDAGDHLYPVLNA